MKLNIFCYKPQKKEDEDVEKKGFPLFCCCYSSIYRKKKDLKYFPKF